MYLINNPLSQQATGMLKTTAQLLDFLKNLSKRLAFCF